jgi:trehalose 6-phosphate phosphatase
MSCEGILIEDKTYSVSIHYRAVRRAQRVRETILRTVASLGGVRVIHGKRVVNIVPLGAPHKGMALERARKRLGCDAAIYVGDDETDEDAFDLGSAGRLLAVRIGKRSTSRAPYCLASQREIDALLRALIARRP